MLYKYRNLDNIERIVDIILNKRLYTAEYSELNDPMEGIFKHKGLHKKIVAKIKSEKEALRICSLSKTCNDALMWAHYADGERGIVIGINKENLIPGYKVCDINYFGILDGATESTTAEEILSCKNREWCYEREVRVFCKDKYINIEIEEIILGSRIKSQHKKMIEDLKDKAGYNFEIRSLKSVLDR